MGDSRMSNPVVSNPVLLVYSHRPEVRERIITAIGRRPAPDVGGSTTSSAPVCTR